MSLVHVRVEVSLVREHVKAEATEVFFAAELREVTLEMLLPLTLGWSVHHQPREGSSWLKHRERQVIKG